MDAFERPWSLKIRQVSCPEIGLLIRRSAQRYARECDCRTGQQHAQGRTARAAVRELYRIRIEIDEGGIDLQQPETALSIYMLTQAHARTGELKRLWKNYFSTAATKSIVQAAA
jgi:hypothetical protein